MIRGIETHAASHEEKHRFQYKFNLQRPFCAYPQPNRGSEQRTVLAVGGKVSCYSIVSSSPSSSISSPICITRKEVGTRSTRRSSIALLLLPFNRRPGDPGWAADADGEERQRFIVPLLGLGQSVGQSVRHSVDRQGRQARRTTDRATHRPTKSPLPYGSGRTD